MIVAILSFPSGTRSLRRCRRGSAAMNEIGSAQMTSAETTADAAARGRRLRCAPCAGARRAGGGSAGSGSRCVWAIFLGNAAVITWLWARGDGSSTSSRQQDLFNSIGRITGMLGAYLALIEIVLLARLPWLERLVGFDKLTIWHRWNGHAASG